MRKNNKTRRLKPGVKLFIVLVLVFSFIYIWKNPINKTKSEDEYVKALDIGLKNNVTISLKHISDNFISDYPNSKKLYLAYYSLGIFYSSHDLHEQSINALTTALDLKQANISFSAKIISYRALELIKIKKYKSSLSDLEKAIRLSKNIDTLAFLYYEKAFAYNRLRYFDKALFSIKKAKPFCRDNRLLASLFLEEAYSLQNQHKFKLAKLLYNEIITKFSSYEIAVKIAKDSIIKINEVEETIGSAKLEKKKLEELLNNENQLYY